MNKRHEKKKQILLSSFEDAFPYLARPAEIRNMIELLLRDIERIESPLEYFEEKMIEETDLEMKTDIKILINALKKRMKGEKYGS